MIKKVYVVDNNIDCGMAIDTIINRIPCFVTFDESDICTESCIAITIECREFDLPFVERMLADFV